MTPLLTATPSAPPTYNPSLAETFSWIPIQGADRPLYAQATYLTNASDISLTAETVSLDVADLENLTRQTNTRLDSLTGKQDKIITLLHSVTSMAIDVDLNTDGLEVSVDEVETLLRQLTAQINGDRRLNGFTFITPGTTYTGSWASVVILSAAKFQTIGAKFSSNGTITNYEFPVSYTLYGPLTSLSVTYGAAIAYKE